MDDLLRRLVAFAEGDENIRAMLLEGSRAGPYGAIDEWSDYDVAFVTRSNEPYLRAEWFAGFVSQFGEVALAQTPDDPALFDDAHESGSPQIADVERTSRHVANGPIADSCGAANKRHHPGKEGSKQRLSLKQD